MNWIALFVCLIVSIMLSAAAVRFLIPVLRRTNILDRPNERSSHTAPTPRGAGLAMVPIAAGLWIAIAVMAGNGQNDALIWIAMGALLLCALSWIDDLIGLSPLVRFGFHVIVVAVLLSRQPSELLYFQGWLPSWADRLAAGLAWVWFINLFNFMDGIDGISGVETAGIGLGVITMAAFVPALVGLALPAGVLVGVAFGFLVFNWHPAKIFLGDSGSVPLGLLLGWFLLELAAAGYWAAALILPIYYLADATLTLIKRLSRGEKIWQAHRQHFYQRAVARGLSHGYVAALIAIANGLFIALAVASLFNVMMALVGAAMLTGVLLLILRGRAVRP